MNIKDIEVGLHVFVAGDLSNHVYEVVEVKSGWVTIYDTKTGKESKVRAKVLEERAIQPKSAPAPVADKESDDQAVPRETEADDADEPEEEILTPGQKMAKQLREARVRYVKAKSYRGSVSAHNGDELANLLAGCSPEEAMHLAAVVVAQTDENPCDPVAKYSHLNPGQQRMNSGNLIRARVKKGLITVDEVAKIYASMGAGEEAAAAE
jgi:hypothetical protein